MAWHYFNEETYAMLTDRFNAYMSENPNVLINEQYIAYGDYTQKLLISAAGGYLPELLVYGNNETPIYQSAGLLEDITDKVNASNIYEGAFDAAKRTHQVDDHYYGVPLYVNCLALYYNTDVIDTPPTTWDKMLETARAVTISE